MLDVLDAVCPDAIARMLQAGASAYLSSPVETEIVVAWRPGAAKAPETEGEPEEGEA
jgi:DNA-binding NarL/FixJ family response regulator